MQLFGRVLILNKLFKLQTSVRSCPDENFLHTIRTHSESDIYVVHCRYKLTHPVDHINMVKSVLSIVVVISDMPWECLVLGGREKIDYGTGLVDINEARLQRDRHHGYLPAPRLQFFKTNRRDARVICFWWTWFIDYWNVLSYAVGKKKNVKGHRIEVCRQCMKRSAGRRYTLVASDGPELQTINQGCLDYQPRNYITSVNSRLIVPKTRDFCKVPLQFV